MAQLWQSALCIYVRYFRRPLHSVSFLHGCVIFGTVRGSSFRTLNAFLSAAPFTAALVTVIIRSGPCLHALLFSLVITLRPHRRPDLRKRFFGVRLHGVLFRLSVSAVSGICFCFTGFSTTRCLFVCVSFRCGGHPPASFLPELTRSNHFLPGTSARNHLSGSTGSHLFRRRCTFPDPQFRRLHMAQDNPASHVF